MSPDFNTIHESLRPVLTQLEDRRQKLKVKGTHTGLIAGGICCLIGIIISIATGFNGIGIIISLVVGVIILVTCINGQSKELSAYYKKDIIAKIVSGLCEDSVFQPDQGIPEQLFMTSNLFSTSPDRYHSEDLISGKIGNTSFVCSEIVAEKKQITTDSKGRRSEHWIDIFRGFFFIADFQKNFKGQTVVYRNSWFKWSSGGQRVKLENPGFEKSFDTYSTDQVEARYLLSLSMMEKLLELDRKFPGKITLSFMNSHLVIAIPDSRDHFEANIWNSQIHNTSLKQEFDTLISLFGIINDLNLNLRIWTKE